MKYIQLTIALVAEFVLGPPVVKRDQRGLSQSTENAILLAGAVTIAGVVVLLIGNYVRNNLPR